MAAVRGVGIDEVARVAFEQTGMGLVDVESVKLVDVSPGDPGASSMGKVLFLGNGDCDETRCTVPTRRMHQITTERNSGFGFCSGLWKGFHEQVVFGRCSATLIAPDRVLTAVHCFRDPRDFQRAAVLFGHLAGEWDDAEGSITIDRERLYRVEGVVACDEQAMTGHPGRDWIVLQLKRRTDRPFLPLDPVEVERGTKVAAMSHPLGLPLKRTDTVETRACSPKSGVCWASFDIAEGSSGGAMLSPTMDAIRGVVLGWGLHKNPDSVNYCIKSAIPPSVGQPFTPAHEVQRGLDASPRTCPAFPELVTPNPEAKE